jgi:organic hydroperoxide reductase OsmC/OhrA
MWNFTVSLNGDGTDVAEVHSGARCAVRVGFPTELGGEPDAWCPERLLIGSVVSCLMTSFRYCLRRYRGEAHTYMSAGVATLDKTRDGLRITSVEVTTVVGVDGSANLSAARKATLEAQQNCPISHSLTCPVNVTWEVNDTPRHNPVEDVCDANL